VSQATTTTPNHGAVISLLRVSKEEQARLGRGGIERQREDNKRTIQRLGLPMEREVEVVDVSGTDVERDPQFQRIFRDLKRPDIAGVVISSLDRLFRPQNFRDMVILDHFRSNGKKIFTASGGDIEPSTDAGMIISAIMGIQAGSEWRLIRKRSVDTKEKLRRAGYSVQGTESIPKGVEYKKVADPNGHKGLRPQWSYTEFAYTHIAKAFDLILEEWSYTTIAKELGSMSWNGYYYSLRNPIWTGYREHTLCCGDDIPGAIRGRPARNGSPAYCAISGYGFRCLVWWRTR
jgi:DNA invertase Pin-like site-specific DNA recombinase